MITEWPFISLVKNLPLLGIHLKTKRKHFKEELCQNYFISAELLGELF